MKIQHDGSALRGADPKGQLRNGPIAFVPTALLISLIAAQPTFAQAISFGLPWTRAEACAENADMLARAPGGTIARKLRFHSPKWARYSGSDAQLEAAFLEENPCLLHVITPDKCPEVQQLVNSTEVGDNLGAKLLMLFPEQTIDMRARFAEVFVKSFCPTLTLPSAAHSPGKRTSGVRSSTIYVHFEMATDEDGFVSPALVAMRETAKDVTAALFSRRSKGPFLAASNKASADIVVRLIGGEADEDNRIVHLRVFSGERAFDFDGLDDDAEWGAAGRQAAAQIVDWIEENRARIIQERKK